MALHLLGYVQNILGYVQIMLGYVQIRLAYAIWHIPLNLMKKNH